MAVIGNLEVKGFEEMQKNLEKISKVIAVQAAEAAIAASAEVIRSAMASSAPVDNRQHFYNSPHPAGQLAKNIIIFKTKSRRLDNPIPRTLVGPEKRKGFYGLFYEKGRKGFVVESKNKILHWINKHGKHVFATKANVGPQPARAWAVNVAQSVERDALVAGTEAFQKKSDELLAGMKS